MPTPSGTRRVELAAQRLRDGVLVALVHDVEDLEHAKDALHRSLAAEQAANEQLRAVEQLRTNFLSAVAHELRTPLTVVLGIAESLRNHDGKLADGQRHQLLERLHDNGRRRKRLLEDLLDLNRLTSGQLTTETALADMAEIVHEAIDETDTDGHDVRVDIAATAVAVDTVQIRRAVANVVRNATVHTPLGTRIDISSQTDDGVVRLHIADHGPGVADALKTRIFAAFEQGPSVPRHRPGTGIGLSLVAEFVAAHGGRAWVEDTPGGGATFVLKVPCARSAA
ncbi:MAG: ATP-binding protein [Nitriliruptoraceae bacterium]